MEKILLRDIIEEATDKRDRFSNYHNYLHLSHLRDKRRIQGVPNKIIKTPSEWADNPKHNPFYVLKKKKQIARSISRSILSGKYKPNPPFEKMIPKKGGGLRKISVYQIPDSAVSDRFYKNLLAKNKHRFSSLSYAYRNDRNVHFAIQDIANEFHIVPRIYVAEFDFSNFFGSIRHDFLISQLENNSFLVSKIDKEIILAFLEDFNGKGIPQGTSISLFLANVACWSLDRNLEEEGVRFARYADDTVIWSKDYTKIVKAFDIIAQFSQASGVELNLNKSEGINILQKKGIQSELSGVKEFVEFLGYKISCESIGIKNDSVQKIKNQVSYLLYKNLIQPIRTKPFLGVNIPANNMDKDFVTAIMQVRRYLYGNMTEVTLKKYLRGAYKRLSFKGIMSFYPLITDERQMKDLDKWLVSTIINTLKKRNKLLLNHNPRFNSDQFPFNCNKDQLLSICRSIEVSGKKGLLEIPSFLRIYNAMKIGIVNVGIEKVMHPDSTDYYDE